MNTFWNIFSFVWVLESIIFFGGLGYAVFLWVKGVSPAIVRLGNGLAKRKIALFAKGDNLSSLRHLLTDSKLFQQKNILDIRKQEDIGRAESATIFLVYWPDWTSEIAEILNTKRDECALIIYAPYDKGRIPDEQMKNLDGKRHTAVTNFRGRLLNDIVASMITTGYESDW